MVARAEWGDGGGGGEREGAERVCLLCARNAGVDPFPYLQNSALLECSTTYRYVFSVRVDRCAPAGISDVAVVLLVLCCSCTPCGSNLAGFCFDTTKSGQSSGACAAIGGSLQSGLCPGPSTTVCCNNVNAGAQCPGGQSVQPAPFPTPNPTPNPTPAPTPQLSVRASIDRSIHARRSSRGKAAIDSPRVLFSLFFCFLRQQFACQSCPNGFCFDTSSPIQSEQICSTLGGGTVTGLCPGPAAVRCCQGVSQCPTSLSSCAVSGCSAGQLDGCFCDNVCLSFGDCCSDYADACTGGTPEVACTRPPARLASARLASALFSRSCVLARLQGANPVAPIVDPPSGPTGPLSCAGSGCTGFSPQSTSTNICYCDSVYVEQPRKQERGALFRLFVVWILPGLVVRQVPELWRLLLRLPRALRRGWRTDPHSVWVVRWSLWRPGFRWLLLRCWLHELQRCTYRLEKEDTVLATLLNGLSCVDWCFSAVRTMHKCAVEALQVQPHRAAVWATAAGPAGAAFAVRDRVSHDLAGMFVDTQLCFYLSVF